MGFLDKYPYTNWHNVNLDWVLERVKEWGEMVEANDQAFKDLEEANTSFKEYVTNYLQDLDVQAAIDDKLDRMFNSGVLGEYLQPYVSPTVTTWLEANITEPEGVVIDSSLTLTGAAADSKAVGDKILNNTLMIASNSLTQDIKDALLQCFANVAWVNTQGQLFYNYLKNALSKVTYIRNHWSTATDRETCVGLAGKATDTATYNGESTCILKSYGNRACVMLNVGASSVLNQNLTDSGYYLIPIPENATSMRIETNDANFVFWTHQRRYNGLAHIFAYINDSGKNNNMTNPHITEIFTHETRGRANLVTIFVRRIDNASILTLPDIEITFY